MVLRRPVHPGFAQAANGGLDCGQRRTQVMGDARQQHRLELVRAFERQGAADVGSEPQAMDGEAGLTGEPAEEAMDVDACRRVQRPAHGEHAGVRRSLAKRHKQARRVREATPHWPEHPAALGLAVKHHFASAQRAGGQGLDLPAHVADAEAGSHLAPAPVVAEDGAAARPRGFDDRVAEPFERLLRRRGRGETMRQLEEHVALRPPRRRDPRLVAQGREHEATDARHREEDREGAHVRGLLDREAVRRRHEEEVDGEVRNHSRDEPHPVSPERRDHQRQEQVEERDDEQVAAVERRGEDGRERRIQKDSGREPEFRRLPRTVARPKHAPHTTRLAPTERDHAHRASRPSRPGRTRTLPAHRPPLS